VKFARKLSGQPSVNLVLESICDVLRRSNCAGALQYVLEQTWILFLRILEGREAVEAVGAPFQPSLESHCRWHDGARRTRGSP
jgi:type I restriction enzyme M protein